MAGIHEKPAAGQYFSEDYNDSLNFILDAMLRYGQEAGSFSGSITQQGDAFFDFFNAASAGSTSNMTWATGSYTCNSGGVSLCTIKNSVTLVDYSTSGSYLVSYWPFDIYTLGSDVINANHGSQSGVIQRPSFGQLGSSYAFNGTADAISVPYNANLVNGSFSVGCWVKHDSNPTTVKKHTVVAVNNGAETDGGWALDVGSNGSILCLIRTNTGKQEHYANQVLTTGVWSHLLYTFNGGTITPYLNGSVGSTFIITGSFVRNGNGLEFGRRSSSGGTTGSYYVGSIDEIGYWGRALTATEAAYIFNSGRGVRREDLLGSVTTAIARWIGSFSSDTTVTNVISLDNGTTWTTVNQGQMGSIIPNTGSLLTELRIQRAGTTQRDNVTTIGMYYG